MTSEKTNVPQCVGIIMDGNRRWARERGLPTLEGHRKGYEKFKEVVSWAKEAGVANLIFYAFSTENWNRSEEEVGYLMNLFKTALVEDSIGHLQRENMRLRMVGEKERFADDIVKAMDKAEADTAENTGGTVALALSYGGRPEILNVVNTLLKEKNEAVSEDTFAKHLWTADVPDPDIIIRAGGEKRLSNFLPWQSVYSELFFTDTYWPAFSKEEFTQILDEFAQRERRRGR